MINPILSFIENMKLINQETETKKLDEHAKFMLAMEAMKLEVTRESREEIARAIDDQHLVGQLSLDGNLNIDGDLGINNENWDSFVVENYHGNAGDTD